MISFFAAIYSKNGAKSRNVMIGYLRDLMRTVSDAQSEFCYYAAHQVTYGLNILHGDLCYTKIPDTSICLSCMWSINDLISIVSGMT